MPSTTPHTQALDQFFRDIVLVLGGVFAVRRTDDETVRRVARGIERVYLRLRRQLAHAHAGRAPTATPHPEIERLLHLAGYGEER